MTETAVRTLCLGLPLALLAAGWWMVRPDRRRAGALLLSWLTAATALVPVNLAGQQLGLWRFHAEHAVFAGMPIELWWGWALLWGPVAVLAAARVAWPVVVTALVWIDVLAMPHLGPVVELGPAWLIGEALAVAVVLGSAMLAGWACWNDRWLRVRAALQLAVFAGLTLGLGGQVAVELTGATWRVSPPGYVAIAAGQVALVVMAVGYRALAEFVVRGQGTPYPWDPPGRLVMSGPYRYLGSPMQATMVLLVLLEAAVLGSWWLALGALWAVTFSWAVARPHEHHDLDRRFGEDWRAWRSGLGDLVPRWRPAPGTPAVLYVAAGCDPCEAAGAFFSARSPVDLRIEAAQSHPDGPPTRMTYRAEDGFETAGVAAASCALEHLHLGWAIAGWFLRLPVLGWFSQQLADAVGAGPRDLAVGTAGETSARGDLRFEPVEDLLVDPAEALGRERLLEEPADAAGTLPGAIDPDP